MKNLLPRLVPFLIVGFIVVAAAIVADRQWLHVISSDDSSSQESAVAPAHTDTSSVLDATAPTRTPVPTPTPGTPEEELAAARSRDGFAALWVVGQQATYRIRYDTTDSDGNKGDSYVIYSAPPRARVDTIAQGDTSPSSQIFADGATTTACSFDAGQPSCGAIKSFDTPLPLSAGPIVFPAAGELTTLHVADIDSRVIAGVAARCFHVLLADEADAADFCFNDAGVALFWSNASSTVEAAELSTTVSDADFQVPAQ